MKTALVAFNAKYIHKNLALRWIYVSKPKEEDAEIFEFTINDKIENTLHKVEAYQPDVIGISVYIWNAEYVKEWIVKIREVLPNCRIVLGGPEVTYENDGWFDLPIDAILQGEGEITFWQYVQNKEDVDGLKTREYTSSIPYAKVPISYLESLESPYFLEMDKKDMDRRYLYVETSRGCPYRCSYCLASLDNQVRMFSDDYLFALFDQLETSGVQQVKFLDRTFNVKPQRALAIAKRLSQMPEGMSFQFEVVAETLSEELLSFFLHQTNKNRFRFEIGLQTFNDHALKEVGRIQNNEKLVSVIERMRDHQCIMHVDLIAGLPLEDYTSFKETFRKLYSLHIDEMQVGILKFLKGTRMNAMKEEYQATHDEHSPYTIYENKWITKEEIEIVDIVAHAVEKCWNSGKLRNTIQYMTNSGWDAFELFYEVGKQLIELGHPYQAWQLFDIFWKLSYQNHKMRGVLMMDYYALFKQRPKRWLNMPFDEEVRKQIVDRMVEYGFVKERLHRYAIFDYGYMDDVLYYQCVVYNELQTLPDRYLISMDFETVKEV